MVERTASQLKRNEMSILANKLGISEFDIQDISLKYGGNFWRQKVEIFYRWRTAYREYATRERLSRVMNEIKGSPCKSMDGTNEKDDTKNKKKTA
ncbi:hypothetical protein HOLleu_39900 [Holothuria leucospilota]|uniref:Death domain-containing protein n=1 Tax=Holothuria leucospilota TaxID=206669 RepID=A0A9Q0YCP2_HOLLE|nr:hypothetical protein HOLleu_39900 [Holothuria leucospilota]